MRRAKIFLGQLIMMLCFAEPVLAENGDLIVDEECSELSETSSKEVFDRKAFLALAVMVETQLEDGFSLKYETPEVKCRLDQELAKLPVSTTLYKWEKGEQTLLYQYVVAGDKPRTIRVLYNGMLSFLRKDGAYFYVTENRDKEVYFYRIFKGLPGPNLVQDTIEGILTGDIIPPIGAEWVAEDKSLNLNAYDLDRLK
jgi:hypothetical protein